MELSERDHKRAARALAHYVVKLRHLAALGDEWYASELPEYERLLEQWVPDGYLCAALIDESEIWYLRDAALTRDERARSH
jgi:hypothetical protein